MISQMAIRRIREALVEFGYTGLSQEYVAEQVQRILNNEKPTEIIGMFILGIMRRDGWLDNNEGGGLWVR